MKVRMGLIGAAAAVGVVAGADAFACGDKFLAVGRGTRYQRPKGARSAAVLFYASPASGLTSALKAMSLDSAVRNEGHRTTSVATLEQLAAALAGGRFDVVFADAADVPGVERVLRGRPDAPTLLPFCDGAKEAAGAGGPKTALCVASPPKERSILDAIDQAVAERDRAYGKATIRS